MGSWASGLLGLWASRPLDFWTSGLLAFWASGLLGLWAFGLLNFWASGLLGFWALGRGCRGSRHDRFVAFRPALCHSVRAVSHTLRGSTACFAFARYPTLRWNHPKRAVGDCLAFRFLSLSRRLVCARRPLAATRAECLDSKRNIVCFN